jgi:hypothetical protein
MAKEAVGAAQLGVVLGWTVEDMQQGAVEERVRKAWSVVQGALRRTKGQQQEES